MMMSSAGATTQHELKVYLGNARHEAVLSERDGWSGFNTMSAGIHEVCTHVCFCGIGII